MPNWLPSAAWSLMLMPHPRNKPTRYSRTWRHVLTASLNAGVRSSRPTSRPSTPSSVTLPSRPLSPRRPSEKERTMPADPAFTLAEHVCQTTFTTLPASAVRATKRDMLDTLGAALGGSVAPGVAELTRVVKHWGGREESSVWLLSGRVPAPKTALVTATMTLSLDFDVMSDRVGNILPGISTLAASLAVAVWRRGITARDCVLAVTLGLDVACRVALAATVDRGSHRTAAMGIFGAT